MRTRGNVVSLPKVVIYGASGHAQAMASFFSAGQRDQPHAEVVAYIDDYEGGKGKLLHGLPVISFEQWKAEFAGTPVFISIGSTAARARLAQKVLEAGGSFPDLHAFPLLTFPHVEIGLGTIICHPAYVGTFSRIGANVQIMPMCSIGHDVVVADCCTICPSCTVSGYVVIEEGVFMGAGSTVVNGRASRPLVIGRNATIAAGSVITKPVPAGATVMGNPARPLRELARGRKSAAGEGEGD